MSRRIAAKITGVAGYVPPKVLTNADLEKMVDTNDEWIRTRTGIRERHIAEDGTASSHLAKLEAGGLVEPEKQGRHSYYRLTDDDVAGVLEGLAGLAARTGHMRVRTGPKDPALRRARICYDHLAGDLGVQMLDTMRARNLVRQKKQDIELTTEGERFLAKHLQILPEMLSHPRRPVCKACLDWSERRHHLAGTLGAAMMQRFSELKWAARDATPGSRVVNFTRTGEKQFSALFGNGKD